VHGFTLIFLRHQSASIRHFLLIEDYFEKTAAPLIPDAPMLPKSIAIAAMIVWAGGSFAQVLVCAASIAKRGQLTAAALVEMQQDLLSIFNEHDGGRCRRQCSAQTHSSSKALDAALY
jgi:hypothetical protein